MNLLKLIMAMTAMGFGLDALAGGGGAQGEHFTKVIYVSSVGKSSNSGSSYDAAKPCQVGSGALASTTTSQVLWAIPAQALIERAYLVIDTAVSSTSAVDIGDDDTAAGLVKAASVTLSSAGVYGWSHAQAGSYLSQTVSGTSLAEASKWYAGSSGASNKNVKMTYTAGGCSAGKFRVFVEGLYVGLKPSI
jgi:hypothetical protein